MYVVIKQLIKESVCLQVKELMFYYNLLKYLCFIFLTGDRVNGWSCKIHGLSHEIHELGKGGLFGNYM